MMLPKKDTNKETLKSLYWVLEQTSLVLLSVFAFVVSFNLLWQTWVTFLTLDSGETLDPNWFFHSTLKAFVACIIGCGGTVMYHIRKQKRIKQDLGVRDDD
jgi:hypothetical protein